MKVTMIISSIFLSTFISLLVLTDVSQNVNADAIRIRSTSVDASNDDEILLEDFENPIHQWKEMNDPVMGGKSYGTFHIANGAGKFQGRVNNVTFLHAPGFIQARTIDQTDYPDISACCAIKLIIRSTANNATNKSGNVYNGYRFSFGNKHAKGGKAFAYGFKTTLRNVPDMVMEDVIVPFTYFTDYWDDATGDPIVSCNEDNIEYCPDNETLQNIQTMAIWGEGVEGDVSLEIKSISAVGCRLKRTSELNANNISKEKIDSRMSRSNMKRGAFLGWMHQFSIATNLFEWLF